jgi:hypothetical protein
LPVEGLLLIALIVGDPGRGSTARALAAARRSPSCGPPASTLGSTALLIYDMAIGSPLTNAADQLLLAGAKVWLGNNIAFALLYWEFDGGVRPAHGLPRYPDLAFPQQLNPELARPGWRPEFLDYLYVGFTTASAFSPTDTMPLAHWAKVAMSSQALVSFIVVGLILARAVNAFT